MGLPPAPNGVVPRIKKNPANIITTIVWLLHCRQGLNSGLEGSLATYQTGGERHGIDGLGYGRDAGADLPGWVAARALARPRRTCVRRSVNTLKGNL